MQAPTRLACILAHNLPVQIEYARRGRIEAILIPHPVHGETIFTASDDLLLAGVEIGMTVYQAQQIAPHAIVIQPNEGDYHARHDSIRAAIKNFSPLMAMAARVTVVEAEQIVERGAIDPDDVHLPGVFVKRIFQGHAFKNVIEQRTVRKRA